MPNHVYQVLKIKDDNKLNEIIEFMRGKDDEGNDIAFDGRKLIQTPAELIDTRSPTIIIPDSKFTEEDRKNKSIKQSESIALIEKYGFNNWYEWNVENMGTKWGIYESAYDSNNHHFSFQSAWSPAIKFIQKLSEIFRGTNFELFAVDEGLCFIVKFDVCNGAFQETSYSREDFETPDILEMVGLGRYNEENEDDKDENEENEEIEHISMEQLKQEI